jgi:hypothetical protein
MKNLKKGERVRIKFNSVNVVGTIVASFTKERWDRNTNMYVVELDQALAVHESCDIDRTNVLGTGKYLGMISNYMTINEDCVFPLERVVDCGSVSFTLNSNVGGTYAGGIFVKIGNLTRKISLEQFETLKQEVEQMNS